MAIGTEKPTYVKTVNVRNAGDKAITLCVEPWADEYAVEHNQLLQIVFEASQPGEPEVLHEPDRVVVYGWPSSTFRVLHENGEHAEPSHE